MRAMFIEDHCSLVVPLTFVACLVHNFLYSYSIKLVLVSFGS